MEKDCGVWISILSHKLKKRMDARMQSMGITGAQSHILHYILVKSADGPVFQRDVEKAFSLSRSSTTGILQNIPKELYEAARLDGAGPFTVFRKITLPYIVFVMTPALITSFAGNVNNFNVIFLLSGGGPATMDYYYAGKTDLLVTWLYNLTITQKDYNLGAVIGIMTFIVLAIVSLLTYRRTSAYKDEGAFQ